MRIIAGEFASRKLYTLPGKHTRPTLDKVKEAVFSSLGGSFVGGTCLDLYAGSGAIGLEALSRGMDEVDFVDHSPLAMNIIKKNIAALGVENRVHTFKLKDMKALERFAEEGKRYALIYLDPPYAKQKNEEVLKFISQHNLLKDDGKIVVEASKDDLMPTTVQTLVKYKNVTYGSTTIHYYRKEVFL